jgi:hypothetical protein
LFGLIWAFHENKPTNPAKEVALAVGFSKAEPSNRQAARSTFGGASRAFFTWTETVQKIAPSFKRIYTHLPPQLVRECANCWPSWVSRPWVIAHAWFF